MPTRPSPTGAGRPLLSRPLYEHTLPVGPVTATCTGGSLPIGRADRQAESRSGLAGP